MIHFQTASTPPKTNLTIENPPFEDIFPIVTMGISHCHVFPKVSNESCGVRYIFMCFISYTIKRY